MVLSLLALPHSHYQDELPNIALARSLYTVNNKVWDWLLCSHVIAAKQAHPHTHHQDQLYVISQVRYRGHFFLRAAAGKRHYHISHSCDLRICSPSCHKWQGLVVGELVSLADVTIGKMRGRSSSLTLMCSG